MLGAGHQQQSRRGSTTSAVAAQDQWMCSEGREQEQQRCLCPARLAASAAMQGALLPDESHLAALHLCKLSCLSAAGSTRCTRSSGVTESL
jgi:hypothetical protein